MSCPRKIKQLIYDKISLSERPSAVLNIVSPDKAGNACIDAHFWYEVDKLTELKVLCERSADIANSIQYESTGSRSCPQGSLFWVK